MSTPFEALAAQFVQVHHSLRAAFTQAPSSREACLGFAQFLLGHHRAEDEGLFPLLRRSPHATKDDLAALARFDDAHHAVHTACEALLADPTDAQTLRRLEAPFLAHLADEEAVLTPDRLARLLTVADLHALEAVLAALRPQPSGP